MLLRRLLLLAALCVGIGVATLSGQQPPPGPLDAVEDEILVKFRPEADDARRDAALAAIGGRRIKRFKELHVDHVRIPRGRRATDVVAAVLVHPGVVAAQPNFIRRITALAPPNDPLWLNDTLWGLAKIQAQQVWTTFTTGSAGIVIADLDTGVKYDHPDLAANMWVNPGEVAGNGVDDDANGYVDDVHGINVLTGGGDPMDDNGHGTHTSGTFGAVGNNGQGVVGVNWNVRILACKFLDSGGGGTDAGAIECFNYITRLKNDGINIRVSNNSWGGYRDTSAPFPQLMKDAVDAAGDAGIINIFAAGNDGVSIETFPHDPASFTSPSIVSVAASNRTDGRPSFTNYGNVSVDLAAPGVDIASTWIAAPPTCTTCYAYSNGTSMAAPHVAGVAGLLVAQFPDLSVAGIKSLLLQSVTPLGGAWANRLVTDGRLNAFSAATLLDNNTPPTVAITSPLNGATFNSDATLTIAANASDTGSVTQVEFFANGNPVGTDPSAPYSVTNVSLAQGTYNLTARATDNLGASTISAPVVITVGIPQAEITQAVTRGGLRLQQLQNADGGWYFRATDSSCSAVPGASCTNIIGVTGLGLLSAYARSGDALMLADAVAAGQLLKSIHLAAPAQQPFSQDLEFLRALSTASGDAQYAAIATAWFGTITAVHPVAAARADWAFARRDVNRLRSLAVWDLASTIRSAKAAGEADYATALANRVIAREADWMDKDVAHRWDQCAVAAGCGPADNPRAFDYTLLGMGSMLWAIHDLPGFTAKIDEYRSHLLEQQDASGTWDAGNLQIASYAALGLGAVGGAGTSAAIERAVRFFLTNQQPNFGWPFSIVNGVAGAEFTTVDSEVMRAIDLLYSTGSGVSVTVAPAQLATVTFETVASAGSTTVVATTATVIDRVPPGYTLLSDLTYEVATTATVSGKTLMCLLVPWDAAADFESVRLLQPRKQKLVDVTIRKGPYAPDASAKRVCAELDSLEPVTVAIAKVHRGTK